MYGSLHLYEISLMIIMLGYCLQVQQNIGIISHTFFIPSMFGFILGYLASGSWPSPGSLR